MTQLPERPAEECLILVVDDDPEVVSAIGDFLGVDGYQITPAYSGADALALIAEQQPDVVILDVIMPGTDGIEICRQIKASDGFLPVILVTGLSEKAKRIDGLRAGADDFLNKPLDPVELMARVRSLLRTKQLYDQVERSRSDLERLVDERTREVKEAYKRVQRLNQVKSNVLSIVSHELRTPLLQATSALDLYHSDGITPEKKEEMMETVREAMRRLEQKVDDIGVFSDPTDVHPSLISVTDLVNAAVEKVRALRRREQYTVTQSIASDLPPVYVDVRTMTRALAHIIDNGVKFSDGGPVHVEAHANGTWVAISVEDKGMGIDDTVLP
ncbi:MAG: response regulator, partial [Anaerolineae bacterium]